MMGNGDRNPTSAANKPNRWFFAFLGVAVVCVALLCVLLLRGGQNAAEDVATNAPVEEAVADSDGVLPSVQAKDVVRSVQSVQSVQSTQSVQSVQSVQWAAGVVIADIPMLELADLKVRADLPSEWHNVLLLGTDSRDMTMMTMFDTIIIASINTTTGELKLTSILRDTMVPVPGRGMQRINTTAYYGGPSLLMQVINANFGMNITEYVLVNFAGMAKAIDALGGIYLDIDQKEMDQINRHMGDIATYTMDKADYLAKREGMQLKAPGKNVLLNGIQTVSYARIRSIDSDAARTSRQRAVIGGVLERIKGADPAQLANGATQIWDNFATNIDMLSAVALAKNVLAAGETKTVSEFTIPDGKTQKSKDGALIDVDLAANTLQLHNFIYGSSTP